MKKILTMVLTLICLLGLAGCDPGTRMIDGEELLENTVRIELYSYENKNPKLLDLSSKNKPVFDFSKATLLATLEESNFEAVIKDIAAQECLLFGNALNEPIGKTMILYQKNGNMVVLFSCIYKNGIRLTRYYGECNVFDENGNFIEHIGRVGSEYVDLLASKYFGSNP